MGNFKRTILLWWNVCRYVLRWMVIYMDQLLSHTSPDVKCMHPAYHEDVSAFLESFICFTNSFCFLFIRHCMALIRVQKA